MSKFRRIKKHIGILNTKINPEVEDFFEDHKIIHWQVTAESVFVEYEK